MPCTFYKNTCMPYDIMEEAISMKFRMIAMDLDGTALQNDQISFSPRLAAALSEAHRRGIAVTPVTGRQFNILPPTVLQGEAWANLIVLCNGSEVRRLPGGELLYSHYMSGSDVLPILEIARELYLTIELSSAGTLYLTREDWDTLRSLGTRPFHVGYVLENWGCEVDDLKAFCMTGARFFEKVNLPYIPDELKEKTEKLLSRLTISAVWSGDNSMEITHRDATKANGLLTVCRLLDIDPSQTFAIGDSGNDIPMLRVAGFGVAMGNAPDEVKLAARAVTAPNFEDGAALAIECYVLQDR